MELPRPTADGGPEESFAYLVDEYCAHHEVKRVEVLPPHRCGHWKLGEQPQSALPTEEALQIWRFSAAELPGAMRAAGGASDEGREAPAPGRLRSRVRRPRTRRPRSSSSPELQDQRIRSWAEAMGHTITDDGPDNGAWHELDVSGGSMDRPKLNGGHGPHRRRRIRPGCVVYSLDRFGRTLIGALEIIERLHAEGKVFASVSDSFDITSDTGRLVLKIMLSLAEFERDRIKTRWRDAQKSNAVLKRNVHISATPRTEFRREELADTKGAVFLGKLIIHPDEGPVVTDIIEHRAVGESYGSIVRWLEETRRFHPHAGTAGTSARSRASSPTASISGSLAAG